MLLPDDRIGLIDFGATKHLTRNERLSTCLIYAALYRKDEQLLVDMAQVNGYKSKYGRKDIIMTLMQANACLANIICLSCQLLLPTLLLRSCSSATTPGASFRLARIWCR